MGQFIKLLSLLCYQTFNWDYVDAGHWYWIWSSDGIS